MSSCSFLHSPNDPSPSTDMSFTLSHEINKTINQLSQLKVAIDEARPISREPDVKAPLTFLVAKDGVSDFGVFESNLPSKAGNIQQVLSWAYITNKKMRKEFPEYHIFVCGKWKDGKWEYIKETEMVDQEAQYVAIMTKTEQKRWRVNGATYALSTTYNSVNWQVSVLATSVFAMTPIFDNNWKRIPSQKEHIYNCVRRARGHVSSITGKDCTTYLEMFFERMLLKPTLAMVTELIKDGEFTRLNDLCTVGDEILYDVKNIENAVKNKFDFEMPDDHVKGCEVKKVEGKILCHFMLDIGTDCKLVSLFVETGSDFLNVLPELSVKFGIPMTVLGCRRVHFYDDDMIVTKFADDIRELEEFAGYLIE
ncbi:unnamed protein product [Bursaphelenchus xylophilus]|uniref:(pine wood nematode) hypothetical protein n=1 Tax=Bursaphelenchus xylophilus TaxID=6326 RepID=A0A1I7S661_BURXY|nr:unnamed protein product [Bursaphelenchus xylophilus]CAG9081023.1 unnamed protein product [Bursaphelenchus xylophilus]